MYRSTEYGDGTNWGSGKGLSEELGFPDRQEALAKIEKPQLSVSCERKILLHVAE